MFGRKRMLGCLHTSLEVWQVGSLSLTRVSSACCIFLLFKLVSVEVDVVRACCAGECVSVVVVFEELTASVMAGDFFAPRASPLPCAAGPEERILGVYGV